MQFDWQGRVILQKLREGYLIREAAAAVGFVREAVYRRMAMHPEFRAAVEQAREEGKKERTYRRWLLHPFRGKRPPTGKGHGGKPRFTYGRRG